MIKNPVTLRRIRSTLSAVYAAFISAAMVFALFSLVNVLLVDTIDATRLKVFSFAMMLALALSRLCIAFYNKYGSDTHKIDFWKNIGFSITYLGIAISALILPITGIFIKVIGIGYLATIFANRICIMFERKKVGSYIFNGFLVALVLFLIVDMSLSDSNAIDAEAMLLFVFVILIMSLLEILAFAFSKIQLRGLLKIIRKTYVFEIVYGLIVLMVAFSFYFYIMEDGIKTFGDGLWYCFAIITTIGFGDFTVHSVVGRILSVILGVYGIIVVASITSVIVNYYNEVKSTTSDGETIDRDEDENKPKE